jgi:hypothetical protein
MFSLSALVLVCLAHFVRSEVTIVANVQTIYDRSPKLRIRGVGFDADDHDISVTLSSGGGEPLRVDKDFMITKTDDGIILKLLTARRWVDLTGRNPPVGLVMSSVTFASKPGVNLLPSPVIVANVLSTPTVKESSDTIYQTATNQLVIDGSGFDGAKYVDLYFDPPLLKEIAYEVVSSFPLSGNSISLRLRHGYKWSENLGPLYVVGIDTGGGPVKLNGDIGIKVGEVQADLEGHDITVLDTAENQIIYHDELSLRVKGTGFNPDGTTLRFSNGILGKGVNYTMTSVTETSLTLRLTAGSFWRKNVESLPGYLTLLAVNAGQGFVAVGPINSGKGRDIARVVERPAVFSSNTKLYRTHSHELHIRGVGFPPVMTTPQIRFNLPLVVDKDYTITVVDRTEMIINLKDGREWADGPAELLVTAINTRGDEGGWIVTNDVHVAQIVEDISDEHTGGVEVYPVSQKLYQSFNQKTLSISGSGFQDGMSFIFSPPLKQGTEYTMEVVSKNRVDFQLNSGKKWRKDAGILLISGVNVGGKTYSLANGDGIRVATILEDPSIETDDDNVHETQSKVVVISGSGFTNIADLKIVVRPTVPGAYKVLSVSDDTIRLQLKPDYDWLPSFLTLTDSDKKIPLQVSSIDTGAGDVTFDNPITIGMIVKDREGVVCDDSCEFAFDGVCDDGTEDQMYYNYYEDANVYEDDYLGGYYGDGQYAEGDAYQDENDNDEWDDDYYMEDDEMQVSACLLGTDCTDCGGVDAIVDYSEVNEDDEEAVVCTNTCPYARDGQCDDPRGANYCILGTDCQDCGKVGSDNFTMVDDDDWDDDDDYWSFNDLDFTTQADGIEKNRHKVSRPSSETAGAAAVFLTMLEGMVYTVGAIFAVVGLYLVMRWHNGQSVPFMNAFNPEVTTMADLEMQPSRRMPITPDVIRT